MPPRRRNQNIVESDHEDENPPSPSPPPAPQPERRIEELFLRQNPPMFSGAGTPADAEEWVRSMERIFRFLRCNDQERILCLSFQLKGSADFWWEARQKTFSPEQLEELTWDQFKQDLYEKYIPRSYRKQKEMEFASLKQGKRSVAEYDREFCSLARYAPYKVDTDDKMSDLFRAGLKQEIRIVLASQPPMSYAEALNRALDMELAMQPEKTIPAANPSQFQDQTLASSPSSNQKFKGKRKWEDRKFPNKKQWQGQNPMGQGQFKPPFQRQVEFPQKQQRVFPCPKCNRVHSGVCKWGNNSCYTCGQVGHYSNNCPSKQQGIGGGGKQNPPK